MAPFPATLSVTFTSNYPVGVHRVCYRVQGSGDPYTCVPVACTPYVPPALPPSCTANIVISVDNETCDPVTYEGYVQATCESEGSLAGRIPFSVTFTPAPSCEGVLYICDNCEITAIAMDDVGSGYDPMNPPAVVTVGGGGTATLTAVVDGGGTVTGITIVTSGGFSSVPTIQIDPPPGPGTQAVATATLENCSAFNLGDNCDASAKGQALELVAGQSFATCYTGGLAGAPLVYPVTYSREAYAGCCYECVTYTITSIDLSQDIMFSDCTNSGNTTTLTISSLDPPTIICATVGSLVTTGNATIGIGASC